MYRGSPVETVTMVGLSQDVQVEHDYDDTTGDVTLIFRGRDELLLSCTRKGFDALAQLVNAARRTVDDARSCTSNTAAE